MIDLQRTTSLISGGLFDPEKTWTDYLQQAENWQRTAVLLTVPLILISAISGYLFGFLSSDASLFGQFRPTIMSTLLSIIAAGIGAIVFAFVVSLLASAFGGKSSFALGLAATTFAFVPGYLSRFVSWVPWVGGLLAFGMFIYGLVLLWKIIPIYLTVPASKRVGHYVLTLIVSIVAMMILSMTVGRFFLPSMSGSSFSSFNSDSPVSGMFGGLTRQAELIAAAQDGDLSFRDIGSMMGAVGEAAGLHTSEVEVVVSADGNWAEHQWVRESLHTAWIQRDINDAVRHNYELYQEFADELSGFGLDYR